MGLRAGQDASLLIAQYESIANDRYTWERTWQDIADNMLGRRDFIAKHLTPGRRRMQVIYDTTAQFSVSALSGGLHSLLTNPSARWFKLKPEDDRLLDIREVALWFEDAEEQMYNAFNRPEARFSSQTHETYYDIVGFGTGGFFVDDVPGLGPMFSSRPLSELYISESPFGEVDTVFRLFDFTARQAVEAWGQDAPAKARAALSKGKSEERSQYLHMVRPASSATPLPFRPSGFPWESAYISFEGKKILSTGGYDEMPYMVPRWEKDSGETYGRGPGFTALADAKMLNEMNKTMLQAGVLKVRPPFITEDEELILDLRPGSKNFVRPGAMNPPVQPLNTGGDLGWGVEMLKSKAEQVQRAFHWDLLQLIRDPRMTATQVLEVSSQVQRLMAPVLGRFHSELLEPIIERVYGILSRSGRLLPPPPVLAGSDIRVEYVSPVARAQRDHDARAIIELFTVGANLAQADPSVIDILDSEEAMRQIGNDKGVPPSVLRSRESVQRIRESREQAQAAEVQRQQAMQTAQVAAEVLPALSEAGAV